MADEVKDVAPAAEAKKKTKKLSKIIEGNVLTITDGTTGTVMVFDAMKLPAEIQKKLMPYGMSQKLGDAAAGKEGQVAVDAINKVWAGLMANDWSVRAPAAAKIDKKSILDKFAALDPKMKAMLAKDPATAALLEALGIKA
jgi:hypothetical protein